MKIYMGLIFYILFYIFEMILLIKYLKLIVTKAYVPNEKLKEEDKLETEYSPAEISHMISIENENYFSETMSKVDSVILLDLIKDNVLKANINGNDKVKSINVLNKEKIEKDKEEILNLFKDTGKKEINIGQIKWKVFGYKKTRDASNRINTYLKEKLNDKKLLNKTAFENIERISKEIFLNFILIFVVYGITSLSFIPRKEGMILSIIFALLNMTLRIYCKEEN